MIPRGSRLGRCTPATLRDRREEGSISSDSASVCSTVRAVDPRSVMRTTFVIVALLLVACGGRDPIVRGGEDVLVGNHPSLMGEHEELARDYLLDMAFVLESFVDEPYIAVDRMRALLSVNGEPMLANARAMNERMDTFSEVDRRIYEAQLSAFLDEAMSEWRLRLLEFRQVHPNAARGIAELVAELDR